MIWIFCICAMLFSGCQQQSQERHYTEVVVNESQISAPTAAVGMDMSAIGMPSVANSAASNDQFSWALPKGWEQEPGKSFRLASFRLIADEKAIDGSIVNLAGVAGGLEGNLRRWMGQIGMKQTSTEDLARLIANAYDFKIKNGQKGKVYDFTSVQEKGNASDKSMIVVMVELPGSTLFIKMTGTIATVKANKDSFLKLAASVEPSTGPHYTVQGKMPSLDAVASNTADPHAGMDISKMSEEGPLAAQKILDWDIPQDWKQVGGRPMRLATFRSASAPKIFDCSVILLGGEAGGLESNLARWVKQVGVEPSAENLVKLTTKAQSFKTRDGMEVKVYDLTSIQGNEDQNTKSLIVGMISVSNSTIFVKMTGSIGVLQKERDHLTEFVRSLRRK